jgi:outer membrane protein insertion porin family
LSGLRPLFGRSLAISHAILVLNLAIGPLSAAQSSPAQGILGKTAGASESQPPRPITRRRSAPAGQPAQVTPGFKEASSTNAPSQRLGQGSLEAWAGLHVASIQFEGISEATLRPIPGKLDQQPGQPLEPTKIRESLRRLYATGLYETIQVAGIRNGQEVSIVFTGTPRLFFRRVNVDGVGSGRLTAVLQSSTQVQAGTPYSLARVEQADSGVAQTLEDNGFYRSQVARTTVVDWADSLVDLNYSITTGPAARVGDLSVKGQSGLTEQEFRKKGKLKRNSKVSRNTVSRALSRLRKNYSKSGHLAATASLASKEYVPPVNHVNYEFLAQEGPIVDVRVEGAKIRKGEIQKLVPVYEEGTVDQDLLNEGAQNLRNFYQAQGYFDVQVSHQPVQGGDGHVTALYTVVLGAMHVVDSVSVTGNKYFSQDLISQRIRIRPKTLVDRHGAFSQQMLNQDVNSIKALYMGSGFSNVVVKPRIVDLGDSSKKKGQLSHLRIIYEIDEGVQQRIGRYDIAGAGSSELDELRPHLNTQVGQPYSAVNLNEDRDTVLTYFMSHGYDNAQIELYQEPEKDRDDLVDISMKITPGRQSFVRKVIISGVNYTKPSVVQERVALHPDGPLNQTALLEMQRKLYDLSLFSEVNTAIQNPEGDETYKNVLLNLTEAKRWDINYGFGFEAQTGTPSEGCLSVADQELLGLHNYSCSPNGHFGASPRILFNISRTNLRGTDQSITLRTNYGTLEQIAALTYQDPHVFRKPNLTLSVTGGYNNSAYISTYRAAVLSAAVRISQRADKANNLIYSFSYRRVSVNAGTLQVSEALIPLLAEPVRVGGPGLAWIRDTRDVPLDAHHGSFTSADEFLADTHFASQADFNRVDVTNGTYYDFGRDHWVFARQTRYGQERSYGNGDEELIPLPERLYAGGATSHRGFAINSAGPRDPQTGYPIGGAGVFVNTFELRSPPPELPYVGNNLSFVLFHDMGNVFENASQIWPSFFRTKQPHSWTCRNVSVPYTTYNTPTTCDFNDFSHALGLGLRYHTPIGPVRVDFGWNLNPPIYPVIYDYTSSSNSPNPHVGSAGHFNFYFSIGQSF